jgi:DNA-nicking Smr family endonuclease
MARGKALSEADLRLWAAYGATLTRLMPGRVRLPLPPEPVAEPTPASAPEMPVAAAKTGTGTAQPVRVGASPAGLDKATWKRFFSGKIRAERRLDLHGHTASRAHHAVSHFVGQAYVEQARCIEIITGKGEILWRELPHWLNAPALRGMILAVAHPHAANTGSVRVLLRRIRA